MKKVFILGQGQVIFQTTLNNGIEFLTARKNVWIGSLMQGELKARIVWLLVNTYPLKNYGGVREKATNETSWLLPGHI